MWGVCCLWMITIQPVNLAKKHPAGIMRRSVLSARTISISACPPGVGPGCTDKTLLSAIASALHTSAAPITGQLSAAVEKNPGVWLNTSQPLCKAFIVTDEDIRWVQGGFYTEMEGHLLHQAHPLMLSIITREGHPAGSPVRACTIEAQYSRQRPGFDACILCCKSSPLFPIPSCLTLQ